MQHFLLNRNFMNMWLSNLSSILSSRFKVLLIPIVVLGLTKSPLVTGFVALSQQLGPIIFAIPIGTWIERKDKVKVATGANMLYAVCVFILTFLFVQEEINSLVISCVLFMMGILGLVSRTAFNVMIPRVAGRQNLVEAHTKLEGADAICTLIGPIIGGYLLAKAGVGWTMFSCGILALMSMIYIRLVHYEDRIESYSEMKDGVRKGRVIDFYKQSFEGIAYLTANSAQKISTISYSILSFSTVFIVLTVIIHANTILQLSVEQTGVLLAFAGVGNMVGVVVMKWLKKASWVPLLSGLLVISGLGVAMILCSNVYWLACVGMFLFDGALSVAFVVQSSVHQGVTPDELLSRVKSATYVIGGVLGLLGTFLSGAISQYLSTNVSLGVGAVLLIGVGLMILAKRKISTSMAELEPIVVRK